MPKLIIFILCLFLAGAVYAVEADQAPDNASSQNDLSLDAARSFGAWYIKYGSHYENFESAWDGWLEDPQVPEKLKIAGIEAKENIKNQFESLRQSAENLKKQMTDTASEWLRTLEKSYKSTKDNTENAIDNWLNNAIRGDEGKPDANQ